MGPKRENGCSTFKQQGPWAACPIGQAAQDLCCMLKKIFELCGDALSLDIYFDIFCLCLNWGAIFRNRAQNESIFLQTRNVVTLAHMVKNCWLVSFVVHLSWPNCDFLFVCIRLINITLYNVMRRKLSSGITIIRAAPGDSVSFRRGTSARSDCHAHACSLYNQSIHSLLAWEY